MKLRQLQSSCFWAGGCIFAATLLTLSLSSARGAETAAAGSEASEKSARQIDPQARSIVTAMLRTPRQARSLSADFDITMYVTMRGMKQEMPSKYSLAVQRPNRFALLFKQGFMGATVVSDGTNLTTYVPMLMKYTVEEAPGSLDELGPPHSFGLAFTGGGPLLLANLFREEPDSFWKSVRRAVHEGTEKLGEVVCEKVTLTISEGPLSLTWTLWIERGKHPFLRKARMDMSELVGVGLKTMEKADSPMSGFSQMLKDAEMLLEVKVNQWTFNPELSADTFTFTPPEGVKKVESFVEGLGGAGREKESNELEGKPAPDFDLELLDGGRVRLSDLRGKHTVMLDFWATWCGPCVRAMPIVDAVARKFEDRGVVLYAVNQEETPEKIRAFLEKQKLKVKVALDKDGKVGQSYGASAIPQTVIIDTNGIVRRVHVGFSPNLKRTLTKDLETVLSTPFQPKQGKEAAKPAEKTAGD